MSKNKKLLNIGLNIDEVDDLDELDYINEIQFIDAEETYSRSLYFLDIFNNFLIDKKHEMSIISDSIFKFNSEELFNLKIPEIHFNMNVNDVYKESLSLLNYLDENLIKKIEETQEKFNNIYNLSEEEKINNYDSLLKEIEKYQFIIKLQIKEIKEYEHHYYSKVNTLLSSHQKSLHNLNNNIKRINKYLNKYYISISDNKNIKRLKLLPEDDFEQLPIETQNSLNRLEIYENIIKSQLETFEQKKNFFKQDIRKLISLHKISFNELYNYTEHLIAHLNKYRISTLEKISVRKIRNLSKDKEIPEYVRTIMEGKYGGKKNNYKKIAKKKTAKKNINKNKKNIKKNTRKYKLQKSK